MEIVIALAFSAAVLFGADRLLLWLERRGHVHWRRTGRRRDLSQEPTARLDTMLSEHARR
ncbi:hypothetical protein ACWGH8_38775 [Nonomuraea muscovyensis]|uniref:Uncharacterized protein n=1 Tax=Nonomuraea muscovyensis TaxID=1124761 RepID=A0A7X0F209_9ACTN|nr:hypothetical protein [Nonomuraea muscovyensis]MBB6349700.1 hypothetical protein [Nonomuraea muscovyensis]MDF2711539.1 hypothetical protein [Nonomuraea muscovyensis]